VEVKAGECHFLPAGTAHSIGPGLLIAEIQTPSDTTYRVFDFNRVDDTGKSRPLHIEQALESLHFDAGGDKLSVMTAGRLVDCEYFKIDKRQQTNGSEVVLKAGDMKAEIFLSGFGKIAGAGGIAVDFKAGDCVLIAAEYEGVMQFGDDSEYLTVTI
jgi:mannose-6-phosphate isomerase